MVHRRPFMLGIGLVMIAIGNAQSPASPGSPPPVSTGPNGQPSPGAAGGPWRLLLRAALVDKDLNVKPIPRFALKIYRVEEPASTLEVRTTLGGTAEVDLPPGNYRVESVHPLAYQGKSYSWRVNVALSHNGQSY